MYNNCLSRGVIFPTLCVLVLCIVKRKCVTIVCIFHVFFFFFEKQTHKHKGDTKERERDSNTKAHCNSTQKPSFKLRIQLLYYIQMNLRIQLKWILFLVKQQSEKKYLHESFFPNALGWQLSNLINFFTDVFPGRCQCCSFCWHYLIPLV